VSVLQPLCKIKRDLMIHLDAGPDQDLRELERAGANLRKEFRRFEGIDEIQEHIGVNASATLSRMT
jgi:hypothetical protein